MHAVRFVPSLAVLAFAALAAGCASPSVSQSAPEPEAAGKDHATAVFAHFKGLAGTWKGTMGEGEKKGQMEVQYRLTAGGSAVEETLFCRSSHEMVTLYHLDGSRLILTHYCAAGNQPTMVLVPGSDPAKPQFEFLRATNLADANDGHMHRASFDFSEAGRIQSRWTYFEGGKPVEGDAVIDVKKAN